MEQEKISVLMTIYKETKQDLKEAFESIINQTYKNIEFIIIIDNPEEQWREELINSYHDSRVKLFVNDKNMGLSKSLNKALEYTTGDYIARMDADDISILDRLEKQLKYLKENDYDLVGSYMQYIYNWKNQQLAKYPTNPENVAKLLKYKSCVLHPTWIAKPEVFRRLKGYRNIFACEDYDFLLRAVKFGFKIANYPEVLYKCRLTEKSISRSNTGKQELIADFIRKKYRKGIIVSEEEIEEFLSSKEYKNKIKSFNFYCGMKDIRARYRADKFPMFYIYSILLALNLKHSLKEFKKKAYNQYILSIDKKMRND